MIDIVLVNWNSGCQLADAVLSINAHQEGLVGAVIIVDNSSTDDSLKQVEELEKLSFPLHVIRNAENRGFGTACNQGAALAIDEFILFMNPDARLFERSLVVPCEFMQDPMNLDVGVSGIQLVDSFGHVAHSCAHFPSLMTFFAHAIGLNRLSSLRKFDMHMSDWMHDETRIVDHVIGAFYLIRRCVFEELEGFDERFFVYLEDLDLSLRANKAGYKIAFLAGAQAFHAGGGTSQQIKARRLFYSLQSRLVYGFKHFNLWQAWALVLLTICVEPMPRIIFAARRGGLSAVLDTWKAYKMLISSWFNISGVYYKNEK